MLRVALLILLRYWINTTFTTVLKCWQLSCSWVKMTKEKFINIVNVGKYRTMWYHLVYMCVCLKAKNGTMYMNMWWKGNFRIHLMLTKATNHSYKLVCIKKILSPSNITYSKELRVANSCWWDAGTYASIVYVSLSLDLFIESIYSFSNKNNTWY